MRFILLWWIISGNYCCLARPVIEDSLMALLKGMNEDQLTRLEQKLSMLLYKDEEEMQGDMPFTPTNDSVKDSLDVLGERDKLLRLDIIKHNVLLFAKRDRNSTINGTLIPLIAQDEMQKKIKALIPDWKPTSSTTKLQGYYPSCELPKNTDEEAWQRSQAMNLYFDLPFTHIRGDSFVQIHSATLKLFKLSQGNTTIQITEDCSHSKGNCEMMDGRKYIHYASNGASLLQDKQIRVSVYWYTRSLKKHRVKKKLLDSHMMAVYGEAWTEFNVKTAVNAWTETGKNFGLTIEVEDEDRVILNALKYFEQMNCSVDGSVFNNPLLDRTRLFPIVDIATIEYLKNDSVNPIIENKHRVRHHHINQARTPTTEEPPANDSIERIDWEDRSPKKK